MRPNSNMEIKSPSTGRDLKEYVKDAIDHAGMNLTDFGQRADAARSQVSLWYAGRMIPSVNSLHRIENVSGLKVKEYIPEFERGLMLLRNAASWRDGFRIEKLRQYGVSISEERCADALRGVIHDEKLAVKTLIDLCNYYDWWSKQKTHEKEAPIRLEDIGKEIIFKAYQKVLGTSNIRTFNLHQENPKLWKSETDCYRIEFDIAANELRVIWKQSGTLSIKRKLSNFG